jgi:chromosome segregation ATPase
MGAEWERQQQRVRAHVLEQEKRLAAQLKNAERTRSFEELKNLHRASRQRADQAYEMLDEARGQVGVLSTEIRRTHETMDLQRARGESDTRHLRAALNQFHQDRAAISQMCGEWRSEVERLNQQTGKLRDRIKNHCGRPGQDWYDELMARKAQRQATRN